MDAAIATVSSIRQGDKLGAVEACSKFLTAIEESRAGMLEAAGKHGSVIPYKYQAGAAMVCSAGAQGGHQSN
jgi:hypothetical protein